MAVDNIARGMAASALKNQGGGGSSLPIVNPATVGQTIKVAAVDGDGKPTEWEAGNVSWNDLEDKPFGEIEGLVEILPQEVVAISGETSDTNPTVLYLGILSKNLADWIAIGEEFVVTIDDVTYDVGVEKVAVNSNLAIGNANLLSDGGEPPFSIIADRLLFESEPGKTSVTISVSKKEQITKTIDPKYLPAETGESSLPNVTTADNGKFLRVVNGAWAASTVPNAEEASF